VASLISGETCGEIRRVVRTGRQSSGRGREDLVIIAGSINPSAKVRCSVETLDCTGSCDDKMWLLDTIGNMRDQ
jgi:hypothetical protein